METQVLLETCAVITWLTRKPFHGRFFRFMRSFVMADQVGRVRWGVAALGALVTFLKCVNPINVSTKALLRVEGLETQGADVFSSTFRIVMKVNVPLQAADKVSPIVTTGKATSQRTSKSWVRIRRMHLLIMRPYSKAIRGAVAAARKRKQLKLTKFLCTSLTWVDKLPWSWVRNSQCTQLNRVSYTWRAMWPRIAVSEPNLEGHIGHWRSLVFPGVCRALTCLLKSRWLSALYSQFGKSHGKGFLSSNLASWVRCWWAFRQTVVLFLKLQSGNLQTMGLISLWTVLSWRAISLWNLAV